MNSAQVNLKPLNANEYSEFIRALQSRYSRDRMESNLMSEEEAIEFTQKQWASLLPHGQITEGHFFFALMDASKTSRVGASWIYVDRANRTSFIFELFLEANFRGKGLGKLALQALQDFAKDQGARTLGLNVFATNNRAKSLYTAFGFQEVSTDMIKAIEE